MTNEVHNPDVEVGNVRRIVVRGLIPGHEGAKVSVPHFLPSGEVGATTTGILKRFYHRGDGYSEVLLEGGAMFSLPFMTEIGIEA